MIVAELQFRILANTSYAKAEAAIRSYLESLIFQGQMLGREFPTYLQQDCFVSRIVMPQPDALEGRHHSPRGKQALAALKTAGLAYPKLTVLGEDLMSNHSDPCRVHQGYILYCRFGQMNSVLYCLYDDSSCIFCITPFVTYTTKCCQSSGTTKTYTRCA